MIGRFRPTHTIGHNRMQRLYNRAAKVFREEPVLAQAITNNFNDESRELIHKRFLHLEGIVINGRIRKCPRKLKKQVKQNISDRYNLCLITLQRWDELKENHNKPT